MAYEQESGDPTEVAASVLYCGEHGGSSIDLTVPMLLEPIADHGGLHLGWCRRCGCVGFFGLRLGGLGYRSFVREGFLGDGHGSNLDVGF